MAGTNPRAARVAALIQRVVATAVEHQLHDKRLANVTITDVRVTNDLQIAKIYWTKLGKNDGNELAQRHRAKEALEQAQGRLRHVVGTRAGLRLTPQLQFVFDEVPQEAHSIEDILMMAKKRDEALALAREHASYAGEADPYRHAEQDDDDELDDEFDDELDGEDDDDLDADDDDFDNEFDHAEPSGEVDDDEFEDKSDEDEFGDNAYVDDDQVGSQYVDNE